MGHSRTLGLASFLAIVGWTLIAVPEGAFADRPGGESAGGSFRITDILGRSELLKEAPDNVQFVEGFRDIVSFYSNPIEKGKLLPGVDYRSHAPNGWWTSPIWLDEEKNIPVVWKTAPVPKAAPTIFAFVGSSINAPPYVYPPPKATLLVNDKPVLDFWLGIRTRKLWKKGDYALEFFPRRVQLPEDGWTPNYFDEQGNSGVYLLFMPADAVGANRSLQLTVRVSEEARFHRQFFMIMGRKDVLSVSLKSVAEEVSQLQADMIQMKRTISGLARRVYPVFQPDVIQPEETAILYTNGYNHLCAPEIIRTQSGKFILTFMEGSNHNDPIIDITWLESRDPLRFDPTKRRKLMSLPGCALVLSQISDGTLFSSWFYSNPQTAFVASSNDDGKTWSEPVQTDDVMASDRIIELPNGELVAPWYKKGYPSVYISKDKAKSWELLYAWPTTESTSHLGLWPEPSLARLPSGRLVILVRYRDDNHHISFSDDNGRSWTPLKRTPMSSHKHPGELIVLSSGELLCSFGYRGYGAEWPTGDNLQAHDDLSAIRLAVSFDGGQTWPKEHFRFLRNDINNWDVGMPSTMELPDGRLYSMYWTNRFKRYFIVGQIYRRWW